MSQANVRSVDAIKDFKVALVTFSEEARTALSGVDMEIRHVRNWLERDQLAYWKAQIKRCNEMVQQARTDLHRRQISQSNSEAKSDAEQKEALRLAQRKLREAEEMVERIKRWVPILDHAIAEYHSQSQPLGDRLAGGLVSSLALLDRMVIALEEYNAIQAPTAPVVAPNDAAGGAAGPRATPSAVTSAAPDGETSAAPAAAASSAEPSPAEAGDGNGATAEHPRPETAASSL
jgi:hypothetical protein